MIGFYNYTVILTYLGTVSGFFGITYIWNGNLKMALICLMIAGFCDMFDGKVASTMKRTTQEKRFGIQIDSLSDLICFGVLPALIVFQSAGGKIIHILISVAYLLSALIRLAWFNVDEEERQLKEDSSRETYLGLPVTSTALLIPLFVGAGHILKLPMEQLSPLILILIAVAFLLPFSLKKPGNKGKAVMLGAGLTVFAMVLIGVSV